MSRRARTARIARNLRNRARVRFKYRQQYGVIVLCDDEPQQRDTFERLRRAGHACRVVTV